MKKLAYTILTLAALCAVTAYSQTKFEVKKIDFNHVKEVTENPNSMYYYPKLLRSFQSNDTTMSIEAYRNFYYGYCFQEDYNPFRESVYCDVVEKLYYKEPHTRAECDSIEKYAYLSLNDNIFDMDQMKFFIYVLKEKKKYNRAAIRQFRLDRLIAAIMSSGRGTKEEPWVVMAPEHEYNIVNFLGFVAIDHEEKGNGIEYVKVQPQEGKKAEGFYFDVTRMMEVANMKFPDI
ncbi:MAG: DUF4919 domain-containing protein [Bacteroidales bacterium]|nr:DUF4919 domain-containing protein [Candidatus Sodaliphilus aphodohippi]